MNFGTIQVANIFVGTLNAIEADFGNEKVWGKSEPAADPWLCFTAEEENSVVGISKMGSAPDVSLEYSTDGNTWSPFEVGTTTVTLDNIGDKMYIRATSAGNTGMGSSMSDYNQFAMMGKISASGNLNTLLDQNGNATLTEWCYFNMFQNCTSLTSAPELPATTLANYCYANMFQNCTSLTSAPELPATTLANFCYVSMFQGCTSLTSAPVLPSTTLAEGCYNGMFSGCSSLTTAPELPATTLADGCYGNMFAMCSNLNTIKLGYTDNFVDNYFGYWVSGVAQTGTFYYNGSDTTQGVSAIPTGWTVTPIPIPRQELCFTAEEAGSTVAMMKNGSAPTVSLEYSTDGNTWSPFVVGSTTVTLANIGDKMYMRATSAGNTRISSSSSDYNQFEMTGKISASGNVDTLLNQNGNATLTNYCYRNLFNDCTSLTSAPDLPATTLANVCY